MKKKPDTAFAHAQLKKDPTSFLESGAADLAEKRELSPGKVMGAPKPPVAKVQKIFRLRWDVASALKLRAAQESAAAGAVVTETEIVEKLLSSYLDI